MSVDSANIRSIRKLIPSTIGEINVIIAAAGASILNHYSNSLAVASVRGLDLAATVWTRRLIVHPIVADGGNEGVVAVDVAAAAGNTERIVASSLTSVPVPDID